MLYFKLYDFALLSLQIHVSFIMSFMCCNIDNIVVMSDVNWGMILVSFIYCMLVT